MSLIPYFIIKIIWELSSRMLIILHIRKWKRMEAPHWRSLSKLLLEVTLEPGSSHSCLTLTLPFCVLGIPSPCVPPRTTHFTYLHSENSPFPQPFCGPKPLNLWGSMKGIVGDHAGNHELQDRAHRPSCRSQPCGGVQTPTLGSSPGSPHADSFLGLPLSSAHLRMNPSQGVVWSRTLLLRRLQWPSLAGKWLNLSTLKCSFKWIRKASNR